MLSERGWRAFHENPLSDGHDPLGRDTSFASTVDLILRSLPLRQAPNGERKLVQDPRVFTGKAIGKSGTAAFPGGADIEGAGAAADARGAVARAVGRAFLTQDARKEGAVLPAAPPCVLIEGPAPNRRTKGPASVNVGELISSTNEAQHFPISVSIRSREPRQFPRPALP